MNFLSSNRNQWIPVVGVLFCGLVIYNCRQGGPEAEYHDIDPIAEHPNGLKYVGSGSCAECHLDIYRSHIETAHYRTSALADTTTVKGNFTFGHNRYELSEMLSFDMVKTDSGLYQRAYFSNNNTDIYRHRMDLVIGSGTKGQSYLTWHDNDLFQLQVSYFKPLDIWINSPGAEPKVISTLRAVNNRCLECHTTFAKNVDNNLLNNTYDRNQILLGIDCERCHGPLGKHVQYHKGNPGAKSPKHVMRFDTLTRQQQLDACALCHSGLGTPKRPSFSFLSGDTLTHYLQPDEASGALDSLDVHSNQYGLLIASKCFAQSNEMSCITCHDSHKNQRGQFLYFNEKCVSCHGVAQVQCTVNVQMAGHDQKDCINCHMPLFNSEAMRVQLENDTTETPVQVRTHFIAVYPEDK